MKFFYKHKKLLIILLVVCIVAPSAFFVQPKKTDAFLSCVLNVLGLLKGIGGAISGIMAVPVYDVSVAQNTAQTASETQNMTFKECMWDALVNTMVDTMIQSFTASTVQWINSGFQGSPSFVTDPEGFLSDYADIAAGKAIQDLGALGEILCSPFDFQIRAAIQLGFNFSGRYTREIGCRLSDVQQNVYQAFTGGVWGADGWSNWIAISHPRNNSMSIYLSANDAISRNLAGKLGLKNQEINLGRGFLNFTECVDYKETADGKKVCAKEVTKTPGSVIENQLNQTLGMEKTKLSIADEVDEIFGALLNQISGQIFSMTGLLGQSQPSSRYNGQTPLSQLSFNYDDSVNRRLTKEPEGLDCSDGPFLVAEQTIPADITYTKKDGTSVTEQGVIQYGGTIAINPLTDSSEFIIYNWNNDLESYTAYKLDQTDTVNDIYKWDHTLELLVNKDTTEDNYTKNEFEEKIQLGCSNTMSDRKSDELINDYIVNNPGTRPDPNQSGSGTWEDPNRGEERNLAFRAAVETVSPYQNSYDDTDHSAFKIVDGNIEASLGEVALSNVENKKTSAFKITLNEPALITQIIIYPWQEKNKSFGEYVGSANILAKMLGATKSTFKLENTQIKKFNVNEEIMPLVFTIDNIKTEPQMTAKTEVIVYSQTDCPFCYEESRNLKNWKIMPFYLKPKTGYLSTFGYYRINFDSKTYTDQNGNSIPNGDYSDKSKYVIADRFTIEAKEEYVTHCGGYSTSWNCPMAISEIEIYGVPESEIDDYIKKQAPGGGVIDPEAPKSLTRIRTNDISNILVYNKGSFEYTITTTSPIDTPTIKITPTLWKISGGGRVEVANIRSVIDNDAVRPFAIYRLGTFSETPIDSNKLTTNPYTLISNTNTSVPLQTAYFKTFVKTNATAEVGFYELNLTFEETGGAENKTIGEHKLNFEIKK